MDNRMYFDKHHLHKNRQERYHPKGWLYELP